MFVFFLYQTPKGFANKAKKIFCWGRKSSFNSCQLKNTFNYMKEIQMYY